MAVLSAFLGAGSVAVKAFTDITLDALKQRRAWRLRSVRKARNALEITLDDPALTSEQRQRITDAVSHLDLDQKEAVDRWLATVLTRHAAKDRTDDLMPEARDEVANQLVADIGARWVKLRGTTTAKPVDPDDAEMA